MCSRAGARRRIWSNDTSTPIRADLGVVFLAVVLDVYSRRIVGWSMAGHLRTELVLEALNMAVRQHRPEAVNHHTLTKARSTARWRSASAAEGYGGCPSTDVRCVPEGKRTGRCSTSSKAGTNATGATPP